MSITTELEPRTYFSRFENALADFAPAIEAIPTILETVRELDAAHVYIPQSRDFIGIEPSDGGEAIAYVFPTFIALHPRGGVSSFVELPQPAPVVVDDAPAAPADLSPSEAVADALAQTLAAAQAPAPTPAPVAPVAVSAEAAASVPVTVKAPRASATKKAAKPEPAPAAVCQGCFVNLPATGRCDFCD
ncbi:hypothetical protein [Demequina pelophila]|uniref:hypothetical protein n=1 Tax=Demequina pelophila TaxID=1638984 RepID=UPI0012E01DDC|nr:hypothetical protein [Demequina pelophila]